MKILIALTYYRPHTSGLTIYAERLARALVKRGHQVRILTSQYIKELPGYEVKDGVEIYRAPVIARISKGVIMPTFGFMANRLVADSDLIHLHLPQFDAAGLALRGRLFKKPTVITYHCDLLMPPGLLSWAANRAVLFMNHMAGIFTHRIVAYTHDYAQNSPFLIQFARKIQVILPPVEVSTIPEEEAAAARDLYHPEGAYPVIGMAARFASEKGVEVLLEAMPKILEKYPKARVIFAGQYQKIMGEEAYFERLSPIIDRYQKSGNWFFTGNLSPEEMAAFYQSIDILVLPSLNSTESFGLVQIEAMMHKVPCVASNLPGVRQPITKHKMGEIVPIGDSSALAEAVIKVAGAPELYQIEPEDLRRMYHPDTIAAEYEKLFQSIQL